ncbi:hypothetical protein AG4045_005899 [Apium graveolens]|uniref:Uncharacterized protein n=1 Tax=Apium graveolens TaxID=4045 RepID=A0A6L5BC79_APIGR|nr:hypothetical protein AG4045_005899 [Apium graveolens]
MAHPMELFLVLRLSVTLPVTLIKEAVKGKGVADESQASKLSGNQGSQNRYLDLDKLAEWDFTNLGSFVLLLPLGPWLGSTLTRSLTLISIQLRQQGQIKGTGPIGVGVQGPEAEEDIFGTICYHALKASSVLAKKEVLRDTLEIQLFRILEHL